MKRSVYGRPTRTVLDLPALRANCAAIRARLRAGARILPVVKANAYGHGIREIVRALGQRGIAGFGVADVSEALVVRRTPYRGRILSFGPLSEEALAEARAERIRVAVQTPELLPLLRRAGRGHRTPLGLHLEIETGMNRLGLSEPDWDPVVRELSNAKGFRVEGLFTHFAESENPDRSFLGEQLARFRKAIAFFESALGRRLIRHAANSGATLGAPETHFDWVRPGIAVYGYPPAPTPDGVQGFRPVLHWRAPILQVKELRAEDSVGYGRAFRSPGRMRIATVGAGYGDGYRRSYGAAGVGFRGRRAPVVGLVCMDLLMVDVTPFPDVRIGEEVTLLGVPEEGAPDAAELARVAGVIPYEVLTGISARVTRTVRHGRGDRC